MIEKIIIATSCAALSVSCCHRPASPKSVTKSHASPRSDMNVVMVHGFLQQGDNFKMLRKRLEKREVNCLTIKLTPSDGRTGIPSLADQLKEQIEAKFGNHEKISIVSFSMGGLVSRYYLQNLDGARRCDQLITVSSPHNGTLVAYLYPGKGTQQMRPKSDFLSELDRTVDQLGDMPVTSYRTPMDLIILPTDSSIWERADNRKHYAWMHPLMLNIPSVLGDIESRLLEPLSDRPL